MLTGANVIKMSVRKENSFDFLAIVFEIFGSWDHIIDARIVIVSKKRTHIDKNDFALILDGGHVFTDTIFAKAADWNNANSVFVWTSGAQLTHSHLIAMIAVVARFINWNANDVLSCLSINILTEHALMMHHLAFARRN